MSPARSVSYYGTDVGLWANEVSCISDHDLAPPSTVGITMLSASASPCNAHGRMAPGGARVTVSVGTASWLWRWWAFKYTMNVSHTVSGRAMASSVGMVSDVFSGVSASPVVGGSAHSVGPAAHASERLNFRFGAPGPYETRYASAAAVVSSYHSSTHPHASLVQCPVRALSSLPMIDSDTLSILMKGKTTYVCYIGFVRGGLGPVFRVGTV